MRSGTSLHWSFSNASGVIPASFELPNLMVIGAVDQAGAQVKEALG